MNHRQFALATIAVNTVHGLKWPNDQMQRMMLSISSELISFHHY